MSRKAALKRFYLDNEHVRLRPEDCGMKAIRVRASDGVVHGKIVGMVPKV